jgi:hypothetical protein
MESYGYDYGPAFRRLQAVWRRGTEVFAEAGGPEGEGYAVHPALLDAALQAPVVAGLSGDTSDLADQPARLPFAWRGVSVVATGADALRIRLVPNGPDTMSVTAWDRSGRPAVTVDELVLRTVKPDQIVAADRPDDPLFAVDWVPAEVTEPAAPRGWAVVGADDVHATGALRASWGENRWYADVAALRSADAPVPALAVVWCEPAAGEVPSSVLDTAARALALVREWLSDERLAGARLVLVTRNATATGEGANLAGAAVWSLLRSAQTEHPDRFVLVDIDGTDASRRALPAVAAVDEPQLAIRDGELSVPRLTRITGLTPSGACADPDGTVLITGGTGALGTAVARHLATAHGARRLLLVSRRGELADDVRAALTALGARVEVAACDVSDRADLVRLLATVPAEHPLTAVVHAAGVIDDGTVETLDAARLAGVFAPKVDAAWHLHELTRDLKLRSFVLFSSLSGILGAAGQANYAAANGFLDALAGYRRGAGLPGLSIAWGAWAGGGLAGGLADTDRTRLSRVGVDSLSTEDGLALFDRARESGRAAVVAARLDVARLRQMAARFGQVPPLLQGLVPRPRRRAGGGGQADALRTRLSGLAEPDRLRELLALVCEHVAAVLGHGAPAAVVTDRGFLDMGLDSLMAVELRNRLDAVTGLRLPSTLVFDYPSPQAIAGYLLTRLVPDAPAGDGRASEDDSIRALLGTIPVSRLRAAGLLDALLGLADDPVVPERPAGGASAISAMDVADLVRHALERTGS